MSDEGYCVLLFDSVSSTLLAERTLKKKGLAHKVIPVPRQISSDCGVCIRFRPELREQIVSSLKGTVEFRELCTL